MIKKADVSRIKTNVDKIGSSVLSGEITGKSEIQKMSLGCGRICYTISAPVPECGRRYDEIYSAFSGAVNAFRRAVKRYKKWSLEETCHYYGACFEHIFYIQDKAEGEGLRRELDWRRAENEAISQYFHIGHMHKNERVLQG